MSELFFQDCDRSDVQRNGQAGPIGTRHMALALMETREALIVASLSFAGSVDAGICPKNNRG